MTELSGRSWKVRLFAFRAWKQACKGVLPRARLLVSDPEQRDSKPDFLEGGGDVEVCVATRNAGQVTVPTLRTASVWISPTPPRGAWANR